MSVLTPKSQFAKSPVIATGKGDDSERKINHLSQFSQCSGEDVAGQSIHFLSNYINTVMLRGMITWQGNYPKGTLMGYIKY